MERNERREADHLDARAIRLGCCQYERMLRVRTGHYHRSAFERELCIRRLIREHHQQQTERWNFQFRVNTGRIKFAV